MPPENTAFQVVLVIPHRCDASPRYRAPTLQILLYSGVRVGREVQVRLLLHPRSLRTVSSPRQPLRSNAPASWLFGSSTTLCPVASSILPRPYSNGNASLTAHPSNKSE